MPALTFQLEVVSPLFLNGAHRESPELRAASVRGQLRYWYRALLGAQSANLEKIWGWESALFGSTEAASRVSVRLTPVRAYDTKRFPLLPHREGSDKNPGMTPAIPPKTRAALTLAARPGVMMPDDLSQALCTWLLLGGIGKRSRRMMGALEILNVDGDETLHMGEEFVRGWWGKRPSRPSTYSKVIANHLAWATGANPAHWGGIPSFPTLHPGYSRVVVCERAFPSAKKANYDFFNELLRSSSYPYRDQGIKEMFGYAGHNGRAASPVIAQVRRMGESYHIVVTAMQSNFKQARRWDMVNQFMDDVERVFGGQTVWGGAF